MAKLGANGERTDTEFRLSDYITHHGDFVDACKIARDAADNEGNKAYWQRQINTLERLAKDYPYDMASKVPARKCECGAPAVKLCDKTPSGGWGTMKHGKPLCGECGCGCDKVITY